MLANNSSSLNSTSSPSESLSAIPPTLFPLERTTRGPELLVFSPSVFDYKKVAKTNRNEETSILKEIAATTTLAQTRRCTYITFVSNSSEPWNHLNHDLSSINYEHKDLLMHLKSTNRRIHRVGERGGRKGERRARRAPWEWPKGPSSGVRSHAEHSAAATRERCLKATLWWLQSCKHARMGWVNHAKDSTRRFSWKL